VQEKATAPLIQVGGEGRGMGFACSDEWLKRADERSSGTCFVAATAVFFFLIYERC